jgi:hypothetical protein
MIGTRDTPGRRYNHPPSVAQPSHDTPPNLQISVTSLHRADASLDLQHATTP